MYYNNEIHKDQLSILMNLKEIYGSSPKKGVRFMKFLNVGEITASYCASYDFTNLEELYLTHVGLVREGSFSNDYVYPKDKTKDMTLVIDDVGCMYMSDIMRFKKLEGGRVINLVKFRTKEEFQYFHDNIEILHDKMFLLQCIFDGTLWKTYKSREGEIKVEKIPDKDLLSEKESCTNKIHQLRPEEGEVLIYNQHGEMPRFVIGDHKDIMFHSCDYLGHMHELYKTKPYSVTFYKCKNIEGNTVAGYMCYTRILKLIGNTYVGLTEREFIDKMKRLNSRVDDYGLKVMNKLSKDQKEEIAFIDLYDGV